MKWETVIGLEVHTQLATQSKIFSGASTAYGAEPNTQACAVDLAIPGTLPVLNQEVLRMAIKFGLATQCTISKKSVFARKNYFYPDLPKGYQISQLDLPIVHTGYLDILTEDGSKKRIGITRAHLEEDAGKSLHEDFAGMTGIDLNRAGTPLLEIVSEPELSSAAEAVTYMKGLHTLVRYLEISDGNMQEGSFRCDANVSIRPIGSTTLGTRTEIKNINSFRFVEKAIQYEIKRHIKIRESGQEIVQETRLYDSEKDETRSMRGKEDAHDYRYFPDPDLLPVIIEESTIERIAKSLPELPEAKCARFIRDYQIKPEDALQLTGNQELANYFDAAVKICGNAQLVSNWILSDLLGVLNKENLEIAESPISASQFAGLLNCIEDSTISGKIAKQVFALMLQESSDAVTIIEREGLRQVTDTGAIEQLIDEIIAANPKQVEQYRSGKDKVFGFFVGQVMKATQGKANPGQVNQLLKDKLAS